MEEQIDIDQVIFELSNWLSCDYCESIAYGLAEHNDGVQVLSCGNHPLAHRNYEPFTESNSFAKTRDTLLQVAIRCKDAELKLKDLGYAR